VNIVSLKTQICVRKESYMSDKKKILMLSDHPLSVSGVGTQSRFLIYGLLATNKYTFRCFGGAERHDNYDTVSPHPDLIIKPVRGFGDPSMLRHALVTEKPDVLLLFTDPRFFIWAWSMEDEIHQICPIAYNHLWDNYPWPEFNKILYESTDLINCINWPTYSMVSEHFPTKTNYIPHAIPQDIYKPMSLDAIKQIKTNLLGEEREDHFVALFVGRNARRKMPSDIIISWKMFLSDLLRIHGHKKATLLMHCDPYDKEGPNLVQVVNMLGMKEHVMFSKEHIEFENMNSLYNVCDVLVNRSCAEGFGLPLLEAKMAGKPIIALKTGGMTRQVEDHETHVQYGIALDPEVKSLVGNQPIPYIYEDYVSHETLSKAFMSMYELGPEKRQNLGHLARTHALKEYSYENMIKMWDDSLTNLINTWDKNKRCQWQHIVL